MEYAHFSILVLVMMLARKMAINAVPNFAHPHIFHRPIAVLVETHVVPANVAVIADVVRQLGVHVRNLTIASVENAERMHFVRPLRLRVDHVARITIAIKIRNKFAMRTEFVLLPLNR